MLTGDAAGHVEGTRFGFSLDCDNDAFDTTFTLAPDGTYAGGTEAATRAGSHVADVIGYLSGQADEGPTVDAAGIPY